MYLSNVQVGADIEWHVANRKTNTFATAEGYIKGTKENPFKFDPDNKFFATSLDNVLAEGNIPPCTAKVDWLNNIEKLSSYIQSVMPDHMEIVSLPSVIMPEVELLSETAQIFGCSVDFSAWLLRPNESPQSDNKQLRSSGFHVHTSFDEGDDEDTCVTYVRALDLFLGVPSVLIEPLESGKMRRILYGKAGCFRMGQAYKGVEYRTLSGYFAKTAALRGWVYDNTMATVEAINSGYAEDVLSDADTQQAIQEAINNEDRSLAERLVKKFNINTL